jgi:hypothetical protein
VLRLDRPLSVAIVGAVSSTAFEFVVNIVVIVATPVTPVCRPRLIVLQLPLPEVITVFRSAISSLALGICAPRILLNSVPSFAASRCHVI